MGSQLLALHWGRASFIWCMMRQPTVEERKQLWKFAYARAAFFEAKEFARMLREPGLNDGFLKRALSISMTVAYTRPFKQRPQVRFDESWVPAEYAENHASIILHRDKAIVHRDIDGPTTEWGSVSDLVIDVKEGNPAFRPFIALVTDDLAERVENLTQILIGKIDGKLNQIVNEIGPYLPRQGAFILNLTDSGPWIEERDPNG